MKKILCVFIVIAMLFVLPSGCRINDERVKSLGTPTSSYYYSGVDLNNHIKYAKYTFEDASVEDNDYFSRATFINIQKLRKYINKFDDTVKSIKNSKPNDTLAKEYDLEKDLVSVGDYFYIYDKEGQSDKDSKYEQFEYYDIYFFDAQSQTLYFLHNNI